MSSQMMEDGVHSEPTYSRLAEWPHFPQTFLSECTPRKTPGPQVGQNSPFRTNSPPSTEYFECLPLELGPSPITHHRPLNRPLQESLARPSLPQMAQVLEQLGSPSAGSVLP